MRLYKSHKVVLAAAIMSVLADETPHEYVLDDGSTVEHPKGTNYVPALGDYYVTYDNDYSSLSPKAAFEGGYTAYDPAKAEADVAAWDATRQLLEALARGSADALRAHMGCATFMLPMDGGELRYEHALTNDDEPELPLYDKDETCDGACADCTCAEDSLKA